jgi:uncharacterized linocin/CFP29 family protein
MQPLQFVGADEVELTTEQYKLVEEAVITAARKPLVGRSVMPRQELNDFGILAIETYTQTDMGPASIGMAMVQQNMDRVGLTPSDLPIPVIWKDFIIRLRDLAASRRLGIPLDTRNADDAGRRVGEAEETLIWEGLQGFTGFMGVTGRLTEASAGSWATAANAYTDVKDAVADLEAAGYAGRPTLCVTPAQKACMRAHIGTTSDTVLEKVMELCEVATVHFFADNASALMVVPDPQNFQLKIGQNVLNRAWEIPGGDWFWRTYEALIPQFKRPTSICEITGVAVV